MAWWTLFSKNQPPAGSPARDTDRLVAIDCALRLTPASVLDSGASEAGEVTSRARKLATWLAEARDERDAQIRQVLLLMTCDKARPEIPSDRLLSLVKELHHYVTRN
ncbi:hypothetical protein ACFY4C_20900 [Actinomadura viridis]|uniref:hypothetical protein n=1 Tax=Actinomadura viridis TaxID=58110 RepID=UPI0036904615